MEEVTPPRTSSRGPFVALGIVLLVVLVTVLVKFIKKNDETTRKTPTSGTTEKTPTSGTTPPDPTSGTAPAPASAPAPAPLNVQERASLPSDEPESLVNSLANGIVSSVPALILSLAINKLDQKLAQEAAETALREKVARETAERAAEDAATKLASKEAEEKAARETAENAAKKAAANTGDEAAQKAAKKAADDLARVTGEKKALSNTSSRATAKAAALGEKNALKNSLKKSQGFASRMKSIFSKLSMESQSRLGLRWSREAGRLDTAAARIAQSGGSLESRMAAELASEGAERATERAAKTAAQFAAKQAVVAETGPIGALYDAVTVVGMAMDMADVGGYMAVTQTSDLLKMKQKFDVMFQNLSLDCGSVPFGPSCQGGGPLPPDTPARQGSFPTFFGPLDFMQQNISIDEYLALQTSNANAIITSEAPEIKARVLSAIKAGGIDGPISDTDFLTFYPAYITDGDATILSNMTLSKMCTASGGRVFAPSQYMDSVCTYKDEASCHQSAPWPPPSDDSINYTYTEWRAQNYFNSFKNGDGSQMITNAPSEGACTVQGTTMHQMCDTTESTSTGSAKNTYLRNTGECVNSREYCKIKGILYKGDMQPSQMGGLGSGPLPSCYTDGNQRAVENLIGSGTIYRFFSSGGDAALLDKAKTHIQPISPSSVGSGNAVVDQTVSQVANGLIVATNAATGVLVDVGQAALASQKRMAIAEYHAIADPIAGVVSGTGGSIGTSVGRSATNAIDEGKGMAREFSKDPPTAASIASGLGHAAAVVGLAAATAVEAVIAVPAAVAAGSVSALKAGLSGDATKVVTNIGTQANAVASSASAIDDAANKHPPDVGGVLQNTAATIAGGLAVAGAALEAPAAAVFSGAAATFSTVGSGDPERAFNVLQAKSDQIEETANKFDKAAASGDSDAAALATLELAAQTASIAVAAITAPLASAAAVVAAWGADVVDNPDQSILKAAADVQASAAAAQAAADRGDVGGTLKAGLNVLGDSLDTGATAVLGGLVDFGNAVAELFGVDEGDTSEWPPNQTTFTCTKGYYGTCLGPVYHSRHNGETWTSNYDRKPENCQGIAQPDRCKCTELGGTVLHPSGDCQKPAWAIPCNIDWNEVIGVPNLHRYCWDISKNTPRRYNKCCAADPTWYVWARAQKCEAQAAYSSPEAVTARANLAAAQAAYNSPEAVAARANLAAIQEKLAAAKRMADEKAAQAAAEAKKAAEAKQAQEAAAREASATTDKGVSSYAPESF